MTSTASRWSRQSSNRRGGWARLARCPPSMPLPTAHLPSGTSRSATSSSTNTRWRRTAGLCRSPTSRTSCSS
eukprot:143970-Alexandrium_andersonii.AAC.1